MIVNYRKDGWEIITQRAHGLLAAQFALNWRMADRPERWLEFVMAVAEHDDAHLEMERDDLLTPQGGPIDFKMREFQLEHGERTLDLAVSKSRYIALLCTTHLEFLAGEACNKPHNKKFFNYIKKQRSDWQKELGMTDRQLASDYRLLEWCDALSLLICQHEDQPEQRCVEISTGPDGKAYVLRQAADQEVTVEPWPFELKRFEVTFEYRTLRQLQFSDAAAFREAFCSAPVSTSNYTFIKTV